MGQDELEAEVQGRSILVTGGAGFIGSHLVDALVGENDVWVLDDLSSGRKANINKGSTLIEGDIRNRETVDRAMEDIDLVFHEAALVSVEESVSDPIRSNEINASGTLNILETALLNPPRARGSRFHGPFNVVN